MTRTSRAVMRALAVMSLIVLCIAVGEPGAAARITTASCTTPASHVGGIGGIQWAARRRSGTTCATPQAAGGGFTLPSPAYRGSPPLLFHGGPVAGTTTPGVLTVTPVYWVPLGGTYSIPSGYESLINRFITDAAADSGKITNVFSALTEYTSSGATHLRYDLHAATPITDTDTFPANGCTPDSGHIWSDGKTYSKCITDTQLHSEAKSFTTAKGLPNSDLAHLYMYFLPERVETCFTSTNGAHGGQCSINANPGFCGYHASTVGPLVANMNYAVVDSPTGWTCSSDAGSNTGGNQSPNANIAADTEISVASHEISETISDPEGTAWYDSSGNEIADDCAYVYGDSKSFQGAAGAHYNQTINGHHYFIQEEFSNQDFAATHAYSCIQREASVTVTPASAPLAAHVTLAGTGFASGETVTVSYYKTALSVVTLCTATSTSVGAFQCAGTIPNPGGALGAHKILAKGATSLRKATGTFTLS